MHTKIGVTCGGPQAEVQPGTKLASEKCEECGQRHKVAEPEGPTSSSPSQSTPKR